MSDAKIELLVLIADLTTSETPANRDLSRKSIGGEVKRLTDNLVKENDSLRTRITEQEARIQELEDGIKTTLKYPRGSEAQIRCLEEVAYYAKLQKAEPK